MPELKRTPSEGVLVKLQVDVTVGYERTIMRATGGHWVAVAANALGSGVVRHLEPMLTVRLLDWNEKWKGGIVVL